MKEKKEINEENFQNSLWLTESPDLIIRTGGEKRTSNFLPWQSVYSEWIFLDKMWPEFTKQDLKTAIKEFQNRERRFGK
ncbi:Tritrans,polycis-undecaprenyl-diphosphate synthase (GGDP specific) [uncultured archaeon]|nr:Tritrans,polycis-undecaprenyl-diphosphate synthase (GGDP specific) [uncultured archaeon]